MTRAELELALEECEKARDGWCEEYTKARDALAALRQTGATGDFPAGKLTPDDEGALMCGIGELDGKVRIDFGPKPIAWLALEADQALAFAAAIIDRAMAIKTRGAKAMQEAFKQ